MRLNAKPILVALAAIATGLLGYADVLPTRWIPFIAGLAALAHVVKKRVARRHARKSLPKAGRAQSGRATLSTLLALLALCPSLLLLTGCPKQKEGETREQFVERLAGEGVKGLDDASADIAAVGEMTRSLRDGGLIDADVARTFETGLIDANSALGAATRDALTYTSVAQFARAGIVTHVRKARGVITDLHEHGALHIKNEKRRAGFIALLIMTDLALRRLEDNFGTPPDEAEQLPQTPLDAELRRRLERARDQYDANDKSLREDLARPATPEGVPSA